MSRYKNFSKEEMIKEKAKLEAKGKQYEGKKRSHSIVAGVKARLKQLKDEANDRRMKAAKGLERNKDAVEGTGKHAKYKTFQDEFAYWDKFGNGDKKKDDKTETSDWYQTEISKYKNLVSNADKGDTKENRAKLKELRDGFKKSYPDDAKSFINEDEDVEKNKDFDKKSRDSTHDAIYETERPCW